jgi:hypothetical protein
MPSIISSPAQAIRQRRMLIQMLVFLLLWGAMAFALHTHHDELEGSDNECQVCLFGALSNSSVPASEHAPIVTLMIVSVCESITKIGYISSQIRAQSARAPPVTIS